jgi:hypothetical protein
MRGSDNDSVHELIMVDLAQLHHFRSSRDLRAREA